MQDLMTILGNPAMTEDQGKSDTRALENRQRIKRLVIDEPFLFKLVASAALDSGFRRNDVLKEFPTFFKFIRTM